MIRGDRKRCASSRRKTKMVKHGSGRHEYLCRLFGGRMEIIDYEKDP